MIERLQQREHRRKTGIRAFEDSTPFIARLRGKDRRELSAALLPESIVVLLLSEFRRCADITEQLGIKLWFERRALPTRNCSVDSCAGKLGTSARTLQKRLTRMGFKFTDIVQSERIELAKHALLRSDSTLDEIAFKLGYSEQTSFARAFKRSTGVTPQAFRGTGNRTN